MAWFHRKICIRICLQKSGKIGDNHDIGSITPWIWPGKRVIEWQRLSFNRLGDNRFLSLYRLLCGLLSLTDKKILQFCFELDSRFLADLFVVSFELVSTIIGLECRYNVSEIFELSEESLILTSALYRSPGADKVRHLFEYFASSW